MLAAICCDRGSPGSTTTALALASARGLPAVVVEADPYGGDLALRCRVEGRPLTPTPTVLGLGAGRIANRAAGSSDGRAGAVQRPDLWRANSHPFSPDVRVVPGVMYAEQGTSLSWPTMVETCRSQTVPVFADLGRIHTGSPSLPFAAAADVLVTVCRDDMVSVEHMLHRLEQLVPVLAGYNHRPPSVVPVVVADRRHRDHPVSHVAEMLADSKVAPAVRGVGRLVWDPTGVALLEEAGDPWEKPLRRSALMKSARDTLELLADVTGLQLGPVEADKPKRRQPRVGGEHTTNRPSDQAVPPGRNAPAQVGQEN